MINRGFVIAVSMATLFLGVIIGMQFERHYISPQEDSFERNFEGKNPDNRRFKRPNSDWHKEMAEKFAEKLNLSEEQKEKARDIREGGMKEIEPYRSQMRELRNKMNEIRKANMEKFSKILTNEQKAKMENMKAHHKCRGKNNGCHMRHSLEPSMEHSLESK